MDRSELLKQLKDMTYDYCESMGGSRVKCRRFAAKISRTVKNAPTEDLQTFIDEYPSR